MPDNTAPQALAKQQPADLEAFDLDGFIAGVVNPTKVVAIAQNRALGQQIQEAMKVVVDLQNGERTAKAEGRPSKRRAATSESPELEAARQELADLEAQAESTYVFVRVEALSKSVRKAAIKAAAAGNDVDMDYYNMVVLEYSAQIFQRDPRTHPDTPGKTMTAEQWEEFAEAVGFFQSNAIMDATVEVAMVGVSPDFSQPASPSPNGATPSKS